MGKLIAGIISLLTTFALICIISTIEKYKFKHLIDGPELKYEHSADADILKLDNGNVLILGERKYVCLKTVAEKSLKDTAACKEKEIVETSFEIYDLKENSTKTKDGLEGFIYKPKGILLKDNKLLLTNAGKAETKDNTGSYNLMIIVNLNAWRVEKIIKKKTDNEE